MKRLTLITLLLSVAALASPEKSDRYFTEVDGERVPILKVYERAAKKLDRNRDKLISLPEFAGAADKFPGNLATDADDHAVALRSEFTGTRSDYAEHYPGLFDIEQRLGEIERRYFDTVTVERIATTHEGRPLSVIKLGTASEAPRIVVVAGQHAREWVSTQIALAAAEALATSPLLDQFQVWIVPLANPDGYHYSREVAPLWRKNRRPAKNSVGVDLNRNYLANYRHTGDRLEDTRDDRGASDEPSSPQYRGEQPLSEVESKAVLALVESPGVVGVLDLHSFGCKVLIPNAPSTVAQETYEELGKRLVQVLGAPYELARYEDLYEISGHLAGHADSLGIPAITLEVGRAFQPHPSRAELVVGKGVEAVKAFVEARADSVRS